MGTQATKYSIQELMNYWSDDTVSPPTLVVGQMYWTGTAWTRWTGASTVGKTIKEITGTISATTDIVAAVSSKRIKVFSVSLTLVSTTAVTVTFQSNASTAKRTYLLQGPASITVGLVDAVSCPAFIFGTSAGEKLTMNLSAAVSVVYNISYWDDDAT